MWNNNHHYNLLQQGAGNLEEESEESDFSQESEVSQSSQGMEFSKEETENLELPPVSKPIVRLFQAEIIIKG